MRTSRNSCAPSNKLRTFEGRPALDPVPMKRKVAQPLPSASDALFRDGSRKSLVGCFRSCELDLALPQRSRAEPFALRARSRAIKKAVPWLGTAPRMRDFTAYCCTLILLLLTPLCASHSRQSRFSSTSPLCRRRCVSQPFGRHAGRARTKKIRRGCVGRRRRVRRFPGGGRLLFRIPVNARCA
jgi:hypothetical protein